MYAHFILQEIRGLNIKPFPGLVNVACADTLHLHLHTQPLRMSVTFTTAPYAPSINLASPYPPDTTFPLSLKPSQPDASTAELLAAVRDLAETGQLSKILARNGAIYFQDLGLKDAHEFSKFAHAFGWLPHEDIGNPVRRTIHAKNVATANEGPNTHPVYPHNEFGLSPHYPAYVLFYCVSPPETGE